MKKMISVMLMVYCIIAFSGCKTVGMVFTESQKAKLAKAVVEEVYANGGADVVVAAIDKMVADGKLTEEQGKLAKSFAQQTYEEILKKLDEKAHGATKTTETTEIVAPEETAPVITESVK